jgi:PilZ domain
LESSVQSETNSFGRDARRHRRFKLDVEVKIHSKTCGLLQGRTVDLSESGISAMLRIEVPVGEMVELEFTVATGNVTVYAMVRQRNAFRYGFQFVESLPAREIILAACRNLEDEQPA